MGKITFRKTVIVLFRSKVAAVLPVLGGIAFLVGSFYFWPETEVNDSKEDAIFYGASWYVSGSAFYLIAPLLDYADMSFALRDALKKNPFLSPTQEYRGAGAYERLYKAQIVRSQRANALLYACAGVCFFAGSFLFYPDQRTVTTHGAWLYLVGCVLSFLAAFLAASTAYELKKAAKEAELEKADPRPWARASTAEEGARHVTSAPAASGSPDLFPQPGEGFDEPNWLCSMLVFDKVWSDEDYQIISCGLYMIGDVIYAVGSVCFFPKIIIKDHMLVEGAPLFERAAVILFVIGSVLFILGALVDLAVVLRARPLEIFDWLGFGAGPAKRTPEAASEQDGPPTEASRLVK